MQMVRADTKVRLTCLTDQGAIDDLDLDRLVDELADGIPPPFLTPWRLCEQTMVAVASDAGSGGFLGILGGREVALADGRRFLHLGMACVAPEFRGRRLLTAMLARLAARTADRTPLIAARIGTPAWFRALRHFAARAEGAAFHPAETGAAISLRSAAAAREIATILCPAQRYDLATGLLHGAGGLPGGFIHHGSADAWCETAMTPPMPAPARLLAVIDLRGTAPASLAALARRYTANG
jgi:hypothetical protein